MILIAVFGCVVISEDVQSLCRHMNLIGVFGCILGVNLGIQDSVYNEQKNQARVRQKHILEKSSNSYFFRDDQTTTGTHKQSLVIKPDYFKELILINSLSFGLDLK